MLRDREGFERDLPCPPLDSRGRSLAGRCSRGRGCAPSARWRGRSRMRSSCSPPSRGAECVDRLRAGGRSGGSGVLRVVARPICRPARAPALAAAMLAEDLAPRPRARIDSMPKMTFIERDGTRREVDAPLGLSVLEIAHRNDIDIEGACEGSLACSTCHVIVDPEWYELLKEASEDEEDMLDLAFGLTATSRLGCQIIITEELDGLTVRLPAAPATCCSAEPGCPA